MRRLAVIVLTPCALMGIAYGGAVQAQRLGTTAQAVPPNPAAEIVRLRLMIEALERRVEELEEQEISDLEDKAAEATEAATQEARTAEFEKRLASLETAQQSEQTQGKRPAANGDSDAADRSLTVVAPFTVQDEGGRTIFRVDVAPDDDRARIVVGNPIGARAEIGPSTDAASVALYDTSNRLSAALFSRAGEAGVLLRSGERFGVELNADSLGGNLKLHNSAGYPIVDVRSKDGRGLLFVNAADGSNMVEVGSLTSRKGYVLANPYRTSTELSGNPSVLMGGGR